MEPMITVVLTAYNVEKYISRSLKCLLEQSYKDFQLIIVDDGSKDGTLSVIEAFRDKFKDITVISQKNSGVSAARNKGLGLAKGKYILFLDSDDLYEKDMLEVLLNLAEKHNTDITSCGYSIMEEGDSEVIKGEVSTEEVREIDGNELLKEFLTHRKIDGYVWNKLFRLEFLKEKGIKFIEGKIYEDTIMIFQTLLHYPSYIYIDKKLYGYIKRKGSITTQSDAKSIDKLYENTEIVERELKKFNLFEGLREEYDYFKKLILMQVLIQINLRKLALSSSDLDAYEKKILQQLNYSNKYLTRRDKIYIFILKNKLFKIYYRLFKSNR